MEIIQLLVPYVLFPQPLPQLAQLAPQFFAQLTQMLDALPVEQVNFLMLQLNHVYLAHQVLQTVILLN